MTMKTTTSNHNGIHDIFQLIPNKQQQQLQRSIYLHVPSSNLIGAAKALKRLISMSG
jgi:hypothetical protein